MMKKLLSVLLALFTAVLLIVPAFAEDEGGEPESRTLSLLSYNVSGIPIFGDTQGTQRELKGKDRMHKIGEILSERSGCDVVAAQEDFNLHGYLAESMREAFPFQTHTSGWLPLGDGLSVFSAHPIFNVERTPWLSAYGVLSGSMDRLAEKGILYCVMELEEGVYVDLYVIHTDAGIDIASVNARRDNFRQLARLIEDRDTGRAVIIIGDFNTKYIRNQKDDVYTNLIKPAGLTDVWAELYNNGDVTYDDGEGWEPAMSESIDKVMFRNGGGVEFTPEDLEYIEFKNAKGETYTDHVSTKAVLSYKVTGECPKPDKLELHVPLEPYVLVTGTIKAVFKAIGLIFTHVYELVYLIGQGFQLLFFPKL